MAARVAGKSGSSTPVSFLAAGQVGNPLTVPFSKAQYVRCFSRLASVKIDEGYAYEKLTDYDNDFFKGN